MLSMARVRVCETFDKPPPLHASPPQVGRGRLSGSPTSLSVAWCSVCVISSREDGLVEEDEVSPCPYSSVLNGTRDESLCPSVVRLSRSQGSVARCTWLNPPQSSAARMRCAYLHLCARLLMTIGRSYPARRLMAISHLSANEKNGRAVLCFVARIMKCAVSSVCCS